MILTADHGNADLMLDDNGNVVTAHSLNPVPFLVLTDHPVALANDGVLADVIPTLLALAKLEKPVEMTGHSLLFVIDGSFLCSIYSSIPMRAFTPAL